MHTRNHRTQAQSSSSSQDAVSPAATIQPANTESAAPAGHTLSQVAITAQQQQDTEPVPQENRESVTPLRQSTSTMQTEEIAQGENQPTGLPTSVQSGVEGLSGLSLDDVHVHYHSPQPAALQASAYSQGTDIYVGPGQEKHLGHEAWHVVQQKQGQVKPTSRITGVALNDDAKLEQEAEEMGNKVMHGSATAVSLDTNSAGGKTASRNGHSANGFPAPSSPQASSAPVQRVAKAKESINPPDANNASPEVPDLSQALVAKIVGATNATERQAVLDDLLNGLDAKNAVDDPDLTEVVYAAQQIGQYNALTQTTGQGDTDPVRITVYPKAFEGGPAVLYSTIRHELIHVGQRLNLPDDTATQETDEYMYDDLFGDAKGRDADTSQQIEIPLQEIETHTWELLHAQETGIALLTNTDYMDSTVNDLARYAATLAEAVEGMSEEAFHYWHNYLLKAVPMLKEVVDAYPATTNDKYKEYNESITKAAKDLETVIDERQDKPSKKRKNGSESDTDSDDDFNSRAKKKK